MPIGNIRDITLRAIDILNSVVCIIVEEYKIAKKNLDLIGINHDQKEIIELNEHNEKKATQEIFSVIHKKYTSVALISDAGVPILADPGGKLIDICIQSNVLLHYIPGGNSLIGSLVTSGFHLDHFYYIGFLPRNNIQREKKLQEFKKIKTHFIILEAPYRLIVLLLSLGKVFDQKKTKIAICFDLTKKNEFVFRGSLKKAIEIYEKKKVKQNFVLIINNNYF